ncbi:sulfite exporter TauE/SafE family protein [Photobacterium leiognathi]|uniref:sulfite exporter TauE/SafE family protein n=1 Tax=Photobacterium leiognathi TaxID=553611 RepID=UPI0029819039|nr:sulfite exporter TauE/SafE family protein [Photobacterium leiognathi]
MYETTLWLFGMCLLLGSVVGLLAGLLGIGGGLLVVPALVWLLPKAGIASHLVMHIALATSLASIVMTSMASARNHFKLGNIDFSVVKFLAPGIIAGGLSGSVVAEIIPSHYLPKVFAVIVLCLAIQMLLSMKVVNDKPLPSSPVCAVSGGVIGLISSLAGIGGGSLTVPYLSYFGVEMRRAIGTSSLVGLLIAISGMIGFIYAGVGSESLPKYSVGYVYLPALIGIAATSMIATRYGAALVSRLPTPTLKKLFAVLLLVISIKMFLT